MEEASGEGNVDLAEFIMDLRNQLQRKRVNMASGDQQGKTKADGVKILRSLVEEFKIGGQEK